MARSRIVLSVVALIAIYIDPTTPTLTRWFPLTGGMFTMDPYTRAVLVLHLAYAVTVAWVMERQLLSTDRLGTITMWADVCFSAAIALVTEGTNSPFYVFFAFAVLSASARGGFRAALIVTTASVLLYLSTVLISAPNGENFYLMRPAYLAITGYLVGYVAQQRIELEQRVRDAEMAAQRHTIARSLHDGYAQALASVNLRLETALELIRRNRTDDAAHEMRELQSGVRREFDELRSYIRSLAECEPPAPRRGDHDETCFTVDLNIAGTRTRVEHILGIALEGIRNTAQHAHALSASIAAHVTTAGGEIVLRDNGVGFDDPSTPPWSIASRVREIGGSLAITPGGGSGAHLVITVPAA